MRGLNLDLVNAGFEFRKADLPLPHALHVYAVVGEAVGTAHANVATYLFDILHACCSRAAAARHTNRFTDAEKRIQSRVSKSIHAVR